MFGPAPQRKIRKDVKSLLKQYRKQEREETDAGRSLDILIVHMSLNLALLLMLLAQPLGLRSSGQDWLRDDGTRKAYAAQLLIERAAINIWRLQIVKLLHLRSGGSAGVSGNKRGR